MTLKRLLKISVTFKHKPPALLTTLTILALMLFLTTAAPAMLIVDTGVPTSEPGGALFGWQLLYGQFTTKKATFLQKLKRQGHLRPCRLVLGLVYELMPGKGLSPTR